MISSLLFLIAINYLPDGLEKVDTALFADDGTLFKLGVNLTKTRKTIQDAIKKLVEWSNLLGFKISQQKTVGVLFSKDTQASEK